MGISFSGHSAGRLLFIPFCAIILVPPVFPKIQSKLLATVERVRDNSKQVKVSLDKSKSSVAFNVTHMVVSEVEGGFKMFSGSMEYSKPDFSDARIEFNVDVKSINTNNSNRDKHLKSEDFFYVDKFPVMKFVSTSFVHEDGSDYKLAGNLTIRSVTRAVIFDVKYEGISSDQRTAVFEAKTTLDRFDYELKWSKATEAGGLVVSKDVKVIVRAAFRVK